jgi:hypothetical protein
MSSQISIQSIMNTEEFITSKNYHELHTVAELRRIAAGIKIRGRSSMKKQELVDAIMKNWCKRKQRYQRREDRHQQAFQQPQLVRQPTLIRCKALCISGSNLTKCTNYSNSAHCSNHQQRYHYEKPDNCPVCMDHISSETETPLECGHWLHRHCLVPTNIHTCPLCRQTMKPHEVEYVFGSNHQQHNTYAHNYYMPFSFDDDFNFQNANVFLSGLQNHNESDEDLNGLRYDNDWAEIMHANQNVSNVFNDFDDFYNHPQSDNIEWE